MFRRNRPLHAVAPLAVAAALGASAVLAHTYQGLEYGPDLVRARVQSPNAQQTDLPMRIADTDLSVVCFRVGNTSPYDARITAIGFELPGEPTGFTLLTPVDGGFRVIEQVAHVPGLPEVTLDFALVTGRTFSGGHPDAGLAPSDPLTTFCVSGPFPYVPIEQLLNNGVLRFQQVGGIGELGDVAVWENRSP